MFKRKPKTDKNSAQNQNVNKNQSKKPCSNMKNPDQNKAELIHHKYIEADVEMLQKNTAMLKAQY